MSKSFIALLWWLLLAGPAWPQENPSANESGQTEAAATGDASEAGEADDAGENGDDGDTDEPEEAAGIVDPEFEDSDLDVQTYEEDDDDFVPSEEIPADEPIPFPSNI